MISIYHPVYYSITPLYFILSRTYLLFDMKVPYDTVVASNPA